MSWKPLSPPGKLYVILLHYPVQNKTGEIIAAAVTNLDLHDIARTSRTYGVSAFYVVTPLVDQQELAEKIIAHWRSGGGAKHNPKRAEAFRLIRVVDSFEQVLQDLTTDEGRAPAVVVTSARRHEKAVDVVRVRELLRRQDVCLVFGTAWGIAPPFMEGADYILAPLAPPTGYNHLPVRSAVAIILDRLVADGI